MPMPGLRSLKGIGRRKSATPGPDDSMSSPTTTSSGSSFRVIPRQEIVRKSIGSSVDKPLPAVLDYRRTWSEEDSNSSNRGSGSSATTANSRLFDRPSASGPSPSLSPIDTSKSSNRLSAISNNNIDATSRSRYSQRPVLKTQSRTFLDLPPELEQEDFGSMFSGLADTKSRQMDENSLTIPPPPILRADSEPMLSAESPWPYRPAKTPPPMAFRRHADLEPSPPSVNSKTSRDGLLSSPASGNSPYRDELPPPPLNRSPLSKLADTIDGLRVAENGKFNSTGSSPLRRSESIESFSRSGVDGGDADATMVRNSVIEMRKSNGRSPERTGSPVSRSQKNSASNSLHPPLDSSTSSDTSFKTPSLSSDGSMSNSYSTMGIDKKGDEEHMKSDMSTSASTTPRQGLAKLPREDDDDEPLARLPAGAAAMKRMSFLPQFAPRLTDSVNPASLKVSHEFQDPKRLSTIDKHGVLNSSQTSSNDSLEEKERRESPTKQSRKDAQEILFRQRLAKDIGDQGLSLPQRPPPKTGSQSAPNLLSIKALPTVSEDGSKSGSDDDDDIPLAVLQAHNFPNRTKMPDPRLSQNSYIGTGPRPPSTFGTGSVMNNRTSLPPFARHLPQDPYGSTHNLLNGPSRESLLLNRTSMYPPGQSPVPGLPPGGLVGVIAEEEKMKGIRRAGDGGKSPMGLSPGMSMGMSNLNIPGLGPGMGAPGMPMMPMAPMAAMQDQGQINQQLLQVVQQQTIMLQAMYSQMQSQMGMGMSPVMDQNGFMQPPQGPGSPRPMSMVSGVSRPGNPRTRSMVNLSRPPNAPRTMSMINTSSPFAPNWGGEPLINSAGSVRGLGLDGGYAPSVAPSERSNIGQPSRYRPVTNSHLAETSSMIASLAPPPPPHDPDSSKKKKSGFFSAIMHPKGKGNDVGGGEEEEDWSSFAKKRRSAVPASFR